MRGERVMLDEDVAELYDVATNAVYSPVMAKQPYVYVDWRKIETVREALAARASLTLCDLSGMDPRHRKTLLALTPSERAKLVRLDDKLASEVAIAAALLCGEKKLADGLGLFDLVASCSA